MVGMLCSATAQAHNTRQHGTTAVESGQTQKGTEGARCRSRARRGWLVNFGSFGLRSSVRGLRELRELRASQTNPTRR